MAVIELSDDLTAALKAQAAAHGLDLNSWLKELVAPDDEQTGAGLVAAMQACPVKDVDLEPARYSMSVRDVSF